MSITIKSVANDLSFVLYVPEEARDWCNVAQIIIICEKNGLSVNIDVFIRGMHCIIQQPPNPTLFSGPIECWIKEVSLYHDFVG